MSRNGNILLIIALIGVGLFIIPSTLSMFAGQHSWYNPTERGLPCDKCHFLEKDELMSSSGPHSPNYGPATYNSSANYNGTIGFVGGSTFWGGDNPNDRCYGCHQVGANYPVSSPLNSTNTSWSDRNGTAHAAIVLECVDCHSWVDNALNESLSSHDEFYRGLNTTSGPLKGGNSACIGCHTHVAVNISWTRNTNISFTADKSNGNYTISELNATGSITNFSSNSG